jgi:hypothetical protein
VVSVSALVVVALGLEVVTLASAVAELCVVELLGLVVVVTPLEFV